MRVGTRESGLAMKQTELLIAAMRAAGHDTEYEIVGIKAMGDADQTSPLDGFGDVGAFVRELDDALLRGEIDISVNSLKDIPVGIDPRLEVAAVMRRDPCEDAILPCALEDLPAGASVGTSSVRRAAQIREARPDLEVEPLRGNIHTRLAKLDAGGYDAIVLARAGLERMGIDRLMAVLDPDVFVPAAAQGAIAVECRADDRETAGMLAAVDDAETRACVMLERAIMNAMGAGCSSPVGINAVIVDGGIRVRAVSYGFAAAAIRLDTVLPREPDAAAIQAAADHLAGGREARG